MLSRRWFVPALLGLVLAAPAAVASASEGDMTRFLPANAEVVGAMNIQAMRNSDTWRAFRPMLERSPQVRQAFAQVDGVNPGTLLDQAERVSFAVLPSRGSEPNGVFVVEGQFDQAALRSAIESAGEAERADVDSIASYHADGFRIAFMNERTVVAGDDNAVAAFLRQAAAGNATTFQSGLRTQIAAADRQRMVWLAGIITPAMRAQSPALDASVRGVAMSIDLSSGLRAALSIEAGEETINQMRSEFETARSQTANSPELAALGLAPLLQGLTFEARDGRGHVGLTIAASDWNRMLVMIAALVESELR